MKYEPIRSLSRDETETALDSGDRDAIVHALVGAAIHHDDVAWLQEKCIQYSQHPDFWVRRACLTALSHAARVHRCLDMEKTATVFERLRGDPLLNEYVDEIADEIDIFLRNRTIAG